MSFISNNNMKIVLLLALFLSVSGCATDTTITSTEKAAIHTVSVNSKVNMPSGMRYYSAGQMGAMLGGGVIGYAFADYASSEKRNHIETEMKQNGIVVDEMLKKSFVDKICSETSYKLISTGYGDAQFKLEIGSYGFGAENISSDVAVPEIAVVGKLLDSKGNILWQSTQKVILDESPYDSYSLQYYFEHPVVLKQAFQTITDEAAGNLIENLQSGN